jgi:hypothetical protein
MRVTLDLAGDDEAAMVRLLKALLKQLGRRFGVRCKRLAVDGG